MSLLPRARTLESRLNVATVLPQAEPIALVCDSPHSGTRYPDDFGYCVALADLRKCEDTLVDALWAHVLPEAITPGQYKQEIAQRIQYYRNIVKTHRIVLE